MQGIGRRGGGGTRLIRSRTREGEKEEEESGALILLRVGRVRVRLAVPVRLRSNVVHDTAAAPPRNGETDAEAARRPPPPPRRVFPPLVPVPVPVRVAVRVRVGVGVGVGVDAVQQKVRCFAAGVRTSARLYTGHTVGITRDTHSSTSFSSIIASGSLPMAAQSVLPSGPTTMSCIVSCIDTSETRRGET